MKKVISLLLPLVCLLSLTACQGKDEPAPSVYETSLVHSLAEAGVFSEELVELDGDTAFALYQLGSYGLNREDLADCAVLRSSGATCEEAAVLVIGGEGDEPVAQAQQALKDYVQAQIDANTDYRPAEIPKLENALISCQGRTILLVVPNNLDAANFALDTPVNG